MAPTIKRGRVIADTFEVVGRLGEGGCGAVYKCKHLKRSGAVVAVKVLEQLDDVQRFRREGQVLRQTKHPNVVRLYGRGMVDEHPYLAMELVGGGSVRDLLASRKKLGAQEAAWLLVQAVRGLKAAGTVHRDLKPENLLLAGNRKITAIETGNGVDSGTVVKVADFGLAKSVDGSPESMQLTHSGQVMGTPYYMSPEQCRSSKKVSFKTDVYAIGIMLFELTAGKLPFDGANIYDVMKMQCEQDPKYPKRMNEDVQAICERCLQKKPGQRYPSLAALERDLARVAGVPVEPADKRWIWRWLLRLAMFAALLAIAAWIMAAWLPEWWAPIRDAVMGWFTNTA